MEIDKAGARGLVGTFIIAAVVSIAVVWIQSGPSNAVGSLAN